MPRTNVKNSPISDGVSRRFFQAIDALVSYKLVGSLESFCVDYSLNSSRYREMRFVYGVTPTAGKVSRYKNVEIEAIYALVANFPISANWFITGRGNMLTRQIEKAKK